MTFLSPLLSVPASCQVSDTATAGTVGSGVSMSHKIERLEHLHGIVALAGASLLERLTALEIKVFGQRKPGSLIARIDALNKASYPHSGKESSRPVETADIEKPQVAPTKKESPDPAPDSTQEEVKTGSDERTKEEFVRRIVESLPLSNISPPQFFRIEPVSNKNRKGSSAGDYLNVVLKATKQRVLRFKRMPIPVYITPYRDTRYVRSCIQGFESWEARTKGMVRFIQVDDPGQARIKVIWSHLGMRTDRGNCALGAHTVTKWKKRPGGKVALMSVGAIPVPLYIPSIGPKYKVPAQIIEVNLDLIDSKRLDVRFLVLKNIVTHELGHAMGILGHSPSRSDMMYTVTDQYSRISQRDINTLTRLYSLKADIPL